MDLILFIVLNFILLNHQIEFIRKLQPHLCEEFPGSAPDWSFYYNRKNKKWCAEGKGKPNRWSSVMLVPLGGGVGVFASKHYHSLMAFSQREKVPQSNQRPFFTL